MRGLELAAAVLLLLVGVRVSLSPTRVEEGAPGPGDRILIALHDAARAGFWFGLGGLFLGFALLDDAESFRWFAIVPIAMAGVRLLAAARLSRRP